MGGLIPSDMDYLYRHWQGRKGVVSDEDLYGELIELARDYFGVTVDQAGDAIYDLLQRHDRRSVPAYQQWLRGNIHRFYRF